MLLAIGWLIVVSAPPSSEELDDEALDEYLRVEDEKLWDEVEAWLQIHSEPWLEWTLTRINNNHRGVLQFHTSRNHRTTSVWELLSWVAARTSAAYGIVYVHDDEDLVAVKHYGRGRADFSNCFRVWSVTNGSVNEQEDSVLTPYMQLLR